MKQTISQEIPGVLFFLGLIWGVFLLDLVLPLNLLAFGVTPRSFRGVVGILVMSFLHADLRHISGNTVPLFVLLTLLAGSRARSWEIVIEIALLGGLLVWLFGRSATHVGASVLIFGLIVFLIVSGFREQRALPLMIALLVGFVYGGALFSGIVPQLGTNISWDGHLCGAIAGGVVGFAKTEQESPPPAASS